MKLTNSKVKLFHKSFKVQIISSHQHLVVIIHYARTHRHSNRAIQSYEPKEGLIQTTETELQSQLTIN